ncbi:MAG: YfhO family protein [Candidatus Korobacteraceae bacterium]
MPTAKQPIVNAAPEIFSGGPRWFSASTILNWWLAGCIVIAVLCLGNLDLLSGKSAPQWDGLDYFGPEFSLVADHIKAGRLVLWDPWVAAGTPDSAEPEFGTTSPIMLAAGLLSPSPQAGFVMYWMFIWILGPIGILVLCRHLRCPVWGGLIAALGFAASGFYTGHAEHTAHIYSVSLLPWMLWRFDIALLRRSYWPAVQAGAIYGVSALGGYPVYTIVTPAFLLLWSLGSLWDTERDRSVGLGKQITRSVAAVILTSVIGAAVMAPAYIGFFKDTQGYSDRTGTRSREVALRENIFPAGDVTTLSSPYLSLLDSRYGYFWPWADISMRSIYMGSAVITLALFGLLGGGRWRWWLFILAILFLCCATGYQLPLRGWLYDFVPPTRYFRNASSFRTYAILLGVILCAFGTRDLESAKAEADNRGRLRLVICATVLALASGLVFAVVTHLAAVRLPTFNLAVVHGIIGWGSIVALAFLLWTRKLPPSVVFALLIAIAVFDGIATLRISRSTTHSPAARGFWHIMNAEHNASLDLSDSDLFRSLDPPAPLNNITPSRYPTNRNLPLKLATLENDITLWNRYYMQIEHDPLLRQMALGDDRIWFTESAVTAPANDGNFVVLEKRMQQLQKPVIVIHSRPAMEEISRRRADDKEQWLPTITPDSLGSASVARISGLSYWPNSLSFHYVADKPGWLMVTDRWAPGWKVTVNGRPQEVLGADFVFRAVKVEAGDNLVQFHYRPWGWPYLLILSWGTLLIIGICQVTISIRGYRARRGLQAA